MKSHPKVSVLCLTYNQHKYIRQCLDSILAQKTNFGYEILVNDDASSDGTTDILKDYENNYPGVVRLNIQKENQYSKGVRNMMIHFLLPKAKGKYIAICEGDDFWTDDNKLQLQVDYLEKNKDCSMCFHPVRVFFENKEKEDYVFPSEKDDRHFSFEKLLKANYIQTNSVMYRKQNYKGLATDVTPGDWYLHLYHAHFGKIGFIDKVMAAYRKHSSGIWWSGTVSGDKSEFWRQHGILHLNLYKRLIEMYGKNKKYKDIILERAGDNTASIIAADNSDDESLIKEVTHSYKGFVRQAIFNLTKSRDDLKSSRDEIKKTSSQEIEKLKNNLNLVNREIDSIRKSKAYRLGFIILYVPKKIKKILSTKN
jgi:glycosyltransferase involved in cell wall biosynthesis